MAAKRKTMMELYFFSGTGNSLFLAKELKKRIPDTTLIPVAALRDQAVVVPHSKKIGFCFPNHGGQIPISMKTFIKKLRLTGDEYTFALISSGGTGCNAFGTINQVIRKKGQRLNGEALILMPSFNPKTDDLSALPTPDAIEAFKRQIPEKLDRIAAAVEAGRDFKEMDAPPYKLPWFIEKVLAPLCLNVFIRFPSFLKDFFYVDEKCIGCGVCRQVCPTGRITLQNKQPQWDPQILCYTCNACLAFCPTGAIQVTPKMIWAGSKTKENPRFKPPFANVKDIGRQRTETEYQG
jgi:ferredoxin